MATTRKPATYTYHRFLDESGDMTFFDKHKDSIIGKDGVSLTFMIGMVRIKSDLNKVRARIKELERSVVTDPYFAGIPSIQKREANGGFFFHAKDDIPEVRKIMYDYLRHELSFSLEVIVARKQEGIFNRQHMGLESLFYADILGHLLKSKLGQEGRLVLNIAERDKSTTHTNLQRALDSAKERYSNNPRNGSKPLRKEVSFNVQSPTREPLLAVPDYALWAVQRVFSKGEMRYYEVLKDKIPSVVDIYDRDRYKDWQNYYGRDHPLTRDNQLK